MYWHCIEQRIGSFVRIIVLEGADTMGRMVRTRDFCMIDSVGSRCEGDTRFSAWVPGILYILAEIGTAACSTRMNKDT